MKMMKKLYAATEQRYVNCDRYLRMGRLLRPDDPTAGTQNGRCPGPFYRFLHDIINFMISSRLIFC